MQNQTKIFIHLIPAYTADRMYWFGGFEHFVKSEFEREQLMLQMILHLKGLDVGFKISQEQPCSSIRDDSNTLSKEEVA